MTSTDIFAIVDIPIDVDALQRVVKCDTSGAIVVFQGVVRERSDDGRPVQYLEYEAYQDMAELQMRQIGSDLKERWPIDMVGIVHRVGRLMIGEVSVAIAIASPHRSEAFDACEYAIDTLKATVAIWKKEVFVDGAEWR